MSLTLILYLRYNHTINGQKKFFQVKKKIYFMRWRIKKLKHMRFLKNFNQDDYKEIDFFFSDICNKNNISYLDLNKVIRSCGEVNKWLFVDALHLTDLGYKVVSEKISSLIK